jgi:hypothetical protein
MGNYLNIGNAGFQTIRNGTYVDKTGLISFINHTLGSKNKLTCVSRPRRFGKSFAAQMLCAYYDKSCDSRSLFEDLEIAKDSSFEKHLNQYDVICLDMTWFISIVKDIKNILSELQEKVIEELYSSYPNIVLKKTLPETLAEINAKTGNQFIIIIDEWDALFREAKHDTELQKEYIQLLRSLFKSALTDKMIQGAYMTGILPIKKYGTQSAMTNFKEYTMLTPKKLAKYVGFTESEVKILCEKYDMDFSKIKHWYDGYSFIQLKSVYNPNSVMEAIDNGEIANYWTQTETYESLKIYIEMNEDGLKEAIVQMIGGAHCPIDVGTFQNDMTSIECKDDILTLLVHLGYLAYDAEKRSVYIPNEEIRQEFIRSVKTGKHKEVAKLIQTSDQLLKATLRMDGETVAHALEEAHSAGTAPLFYNDEQALRSVIRFAYISCVDKFLRVEELPTGIGYADVVYLPKKGSTMPIMVVELKWNKSAEGAIAQIKNRNYPQALEGFGSDILLVGVNYDEKSKKHTCIIEKYKK